jgi:hypothetical protein
MALPSPCYDRIPWIMLILAGLYSKGRQQVVILELAYIQA